MHKGYIEYVFEGGVVAAAVILLFLVVYVRAWPRLLRLPRWGTLSFMQAGAGLGLLLALHGLTDYNWHIPANAIYFALMAGVFLHRGETPREHAAPQVRSPSGIHTRVGAGGAAERQQPVCRLAAIPPRST